MSEPDAPDRQVRAIAAIDIDGVLADVRHRLSHLASRPKDYGSFFRAAPLDPPLAEGLETAHRLAEVFEVVYLSGRPEWCRADTLAWLARHGVPGGELHLRPHRDYRPAREYKLAVLHRLRRRAPVAVVVDDDAGVLDAARAAGFDVLPATWMATATDLHRSQEEGRA